MDTVEDVKKKIKFLESMKEKRIKKSLTQEEIAQKIGVSVFTYQKWEHKKSYPTAENEKNIIKILGE